MNTSDRWRRQEGGAMVEFAILMIVFIPMLTYSFYLQDVGHHMLDLQETVISATWDFTGLTNQSRGPTKDKSVRQAVVQENRFEFLDHTSAYDDYKSISQYGTRAGKKSYAKDEANYHFEFGAKAAFIGKSGNGDDFPAYKSDYNTDNARQVTCKLNNKKDLDWINLGFSGGAGGLAPAYHFGEQAAYNNGGVITCWAKLSVFNYVIPEKFMQKHAHEDMTKSKLNKRSQNVEKLSSAAKPLILRDHAALSYGTWAINDGETGDMPSRTTDTSGDIKYNTWSKDLFPTATNPFYERVAWIYSGGGVSVSGISADFVGIAYKTRVAADGLNLFRVARSDKVANVVAIPVVPGKTDAAPDVLPLYFGAAGAQMGALSGIPANTIGVELVARHHRDTGDTGVDKATDMDFLSNDPSHESWPSQKGNPKFHQAWRNRGQYFLGRTTAQHL